MSLMVSRLEIQYAACIMQVWGPRAAGGIVCRVGRWDIFAHRFSTPALRALVSDCSRPRSSARLAILVDLGLGHDLSGIPPRSGLNHGRFRRGTKRTPRLSSPIVRRCVSWIETDQSKLKQFVGFCFCYIPTWSVEYSDVYLGYLLFTS